jgi:aquaporin Z
MIKNEDIDLKSFHDSSREGQRIFAEMWGTFLSVLASLATKVLFIKTGQVSWEMMALARGLVVTIVIYFMGSVSGAHLNPVVTLGFAIRRNFPWGRVPGYLIAQFTGAFIAGLLVLYLFGTDGQLGATMPGKGFSDLQALILEMVLTAGLINTILGTAYEGRNIGANGGIAVGGYIVLASILGLSVSGASMNPFRSLVPDILRGDYSSTWIYIIAPLAGMAIGVIFETILRGEPGREGTKIAQGR